MGKRAVDADAAKREQLFTELTKGPSDNFGVIEVEELPLSLDRLMPVRRYRFSEFNSNSGDVFLREFRDFLEVNQYLLDANKTAEYADGFGEAVALAALYLDSIGIEKDTTACPGP